jgi:hypothetical protein
MSKTDLLIAVNTVWVVVAAVLVMFMQAGFQNGGTHGSPVGPLLHAFPGQSDTRATPR